MALKTLTGHGAPTTETKGTVGQHYTDLDSGTKYVCVGLRSNANWEDDPVEPHDFVSHKKFAGIDSGYGWEECAGYKIKDFSYFCMDGYRIDELPFIDFSDATSYAYMFANTNITEIPKITINHGAIINSMFNACTGLETIKDVDFSGAGKATSVFKGCTKIQSVENLNVSGANSVSSIFEGCTSLLTVDNVDFSGCTSGGKNAFKGCKKLKTVNNVKWGEEDDFNGTFFDCTALETVTNFDMRATEISLYQTFWKCTSLTTIPDFSSKKIDQLYSAFGYCSSLTDIYNLDIDKVTGSAYAAFTDCSSLTNLYLYNIRVPITIGSGTSYGHLLTVDSLVHTVKELCKVTSSTTLTMGATNLAKIADLYCRVLDDTTEKIEMELCESTDEGAMTLEAYAALKNWTLA